jgi:hypothetical protein
MVFFTSGAYRGYNTNGFHPEPMGYETGFSVKWAIDAQINQVANGGIVHDPVAGDLDYTTGVAPWLGWSVYWWSDGTSSRNSDGLAWFPDEYLTLDFVHLDQTGYSKVGMMIMHFFTNSPWTHCWFVGDGPCE